MRKRLSPELRAQLTTPVDDRVQVAVARFKGRVERNKTRRRRDGDPPAALPVPVVSPKGGGWSGGAAAVLEFDET